MHLPDPDTSYAVLIGVGRYGDAELTDLKGVHAGAQRLRDLLTDPVSGSLKPENCIVVPEDATTVDVGEAIRHAAAKAEDLLLVYYAGHGLRAWEHNDLVLSVEGTRVQNPTFTGVRFDNIRGLVRASAARARVVVLDCCLSGRAIGRTMAEPGEPIGDEVRIEGAATLTSVPPNADAIILDGEEYPAYTHRLAQLLEHGVAGGQEFLTISEIKTALHRACIRDGLRGPQADTTALIDQLALVRNRPFVPAPLVDPGFELERQQREDLDLIAQATEILTDLEYPYALRDIAELLGTMVRWAGFYVNDDGLTHADGIDVNAPPSGRGRRHARYIPRDGLTPRGERPRRLPTEPLGDPTSAGGALAPVLEAVDSVQDLLDGLLDGSVTLHLGIAHAPYSASGWLSRDLGRRVGEETGEVPRSFVAYAVAGRHRVLGLLVVWLHEPPDDEQMLPDGMDEPEERVRAVVEVVARRAGTAIDNARMYAREHRLAETLQRAMLPEQAEVAGLDVWTYYAPNAEHAQVGGDWYDVLQIAPELVGLVIGDVAGHDLEAAATMGQLRAAVRAYAVDGSRPDHVLSRVDRLVAVLGMARPASAVYAALRREAEGDVWTLEYSRAGHMPPLLLRGRTVTVLDGGSGGIIGFWSGIREVSDAALQRGDSLIFYTNGLIHRRDRQVVTGFLDILEMAAEITAPDAAGIGEELLSRLADSPEDDVAIVVVRIPDPVRDASEPALSPRWRRWKLPSEPSAIGRARRAVLRTCQAWGIDESAAAELVVSELVANGVLFGGAQIALRLFDTGGGLRIEVEDSNPAPPVLRDGSPNRLGGFGMQIVERLAEWGWRPTGSGKIVWAVVRPTRARRDRPPHTG